VDAPFAANLSCACQFWGRLYLLAGSLWSRIGGVGVAEGLQAVVGGMETWRGEMETGWRWTGWETSRMIVGLAGSS